MTNNNWIACGNAPVRIAEGQAVRLNNHEIIVSIKDVPSNTSINGSVHRLLKYDSRCDEWMEFNKLTIADLPCFGPDSGTEYVKIAIIPETKTLYFVFSRSEMIVFNIETLKWCKETIHQRNPMNLNLNGLNPLVNANGILHCIAGPDEAHHCVWMDHNWLCLHDFGAIAGAPRNIDDDRVLDDIYNFSMIFVESKQLILVIGAMGGIWSFSTKFINENTWKRIESVEFPYTVTSAVVTADEQYVIISGGLRQSSLLEYRYDDPSDLIHVLDLRDDEQFVLRQCTIRCPVMSPCITMRTGSGMSDENQLFVVGWTRNVFADKEMKDLQIPSDDLIRIIVLYYDQEMLHWVHCECREQMIAQEDESDNCPRMEIDHHYVIPMQDVLLSVQ